MDAVHVRVPMVTPGRATRLKAQGREATLLARADEVIE